MSEYDVDYSGLDNGSTTSTNFSNQTQQTQSSLSDAKTKLDNESVFMGPIKDNVVDELKTFDTEFSEIEKVYSSIGNYLKTINEGYQKGDNKARNLLSNSSTAAPYNNKSGAAEDKVDFINSIKDGAVKSYNDYGVLPSLTMAQAILESGWGSNSIGNNIFGIKAGSSWTGKTQESLTSEQNDDGSFVQITATFRDYDSIDDSIKDHAVLLTSDRYQPVLDATNYKDACYAVKNCGYATDHKYPEKLISIIEQYGLDQWDPKTT